MEEELKKFVEQFGEKAKRTIRDRITVHNWPYGKPNRILSVGDEPVIKDNIFAATKEGVSYLGNIDDFNINYITKTDEFSKEIPLGITMLEIYERLMVIESGEISWENKNVLDLSNCSEEEIAERKLEVYTGKHAEHYTVFLPKRAFHGMFCLSLGNLRFEEFSKLHANCLEEVIEAAKTFTKEHNSACLVAKQLYSCNWH